MASYPKRKLVQILSKLANANFHEDSFSNCLMLDGRRDRRKEFNRLFRTADSQKKMHAKKKRGLFQTEFAFCESHGSHPKGDIHSNHPTRNNSGSTITAAWLDACSSVMGVSRNVERTRKVHLLALHYTSPRGLPYQQHDLACRLSY
jgi:hypothetical protein